MNASVLAILVGLLIVAPVAIYGLFRPFLGLLVLMTIHFVQPGELFPQLAPLRIELVYGLLMLVVLVWRKASLTGSVVKNDPVARSALWLLGLVVVTIPFAIWRGGALETAVELAKVIVLQLLLTVLIDSQDKLRYVLWLLAGLLTWFSGSSLSAYLHGDYYTVNGVQRAHGVNSVAGDANELAGLLLALLPFLVALIASSKRFLIKLVLIACGGLALTALLLTGARIAIISLMCIILVYVLQIRRRFLALTIAAILGAAVWFALPRQYQERYLTVQRYAEGGQLDDSNQLRLHIWDVGWRMFIDHPILGVGAGQFANAYGMHYMQRGSHAAWMQPHNLFLQLICELGLAGVVVFGNYIRQVFKAIRTVLGVKDRPGMELNYNFAKACSFMMLGIGVISFVSHTLYRPYWYLLGGLVAANRSVTLGQLDQNAEPAAESSDQGYEKDEALTAIRSRIIWR